MEDTYIEHSHENSRRRSGAVMRSIESLFEFVTSSLRIIAHEKALFMGVALTLVGLLSFESGKFCDGNTADYLSCTRPSTYYFFSPLEITIIVIGVFFILIWLLGRPKHRS